MKDMVLWEEWEKPGGKVSLDEEEMAEEVS